MADLKFAPGIVSEKTALQVGAGWVDGNLGRFRDGNFSPVGGWTKFAFGSVTGVCRQMHEWSNLDGTIILALGTHLKVYVLCANAFYDITPLRRAIACPTNPFATVADPLKLQLSIPYHCAVANDYIHVSGSTAGCGAYTAAQLNVVWQVDSVVDLNTLILKGTLSAGAAGQVGGGTTVLAQPEAQTGLVDAQVATGFGVGAYNVGTYNTIRAPSSNNLSDIVLQPRIWYLDNFGEDLILNPRGGHIYIWHATGGFGQRAALLSDDPSSSDVPEFANGVFVDHQAQTVIAVGCCPLGRRSPDPMQIRWTDLRNPYDWTPRTSNSAGDYRLPSGSLIIGWLPTYYETLFWTDNTVYVMQFQGNNNVYGFEPIANGISMISPRAAISNGSLIGWMDRGSFYIYTGSVQELECPLKKEIFDNINLDQSWKVHAAHIHSFSTIRWFYPSKDSMEIDSYVDWNYKDNLWAKGNLNRTAWSDSGRLSTPIGSDEIGNVYFHETGTDANGEPLPYSLQSGDISIQGGEYFVTLDRLIPDFKFEKDLGQNQRTFVDIMVRDSTREPRRVVKTVIVTPNKVNRGAIDCKVRGRYISFRIRNDPYTTGTSFVLGTCQAFYHASGKR